MRKVSLLIMVLAATFSGYQLMQKNARELPVTNEADHWYAKGEKATTLYERKESFNRALEQYIALEQNNNPEFSTGKLYYNIGNSYYQLEQYPWAVLYYYRAEALRPRDQTIAFNLQSALEKLGIENPVNATVFDQIFLFHKFLSLPERLQLVGLFTTLLFVFGSIYYWSGGIWIYRTAFISGLLCFGMLLSVGYSRYVDSVKGVVIESTYLRRDAGEQYAQIGDEPVLSGLKVEILDVTESGKWIKVMTPEGVVGYLSFEKIRKI